MTGGPSMVFTRKAVANEKLFKNQTFCVNKSLRLMPVSSILIPCVRVMPTGLYTMWDYNEEIKSSSHF